MNHLVKILVNDDGQKDENPKWHLVSHFGDAHRTVCTGEVFGYGEGSAVFKEKISERGITCESCREIIEWFKKIKL